MTAELLTCMFSFTNTMHDICSINDMQLHGSFMYTLTICILGNCQILLSSADVFHK